jgi:hypothetical protein
MATISNGSTTITPKAKLTAEESVDSRNLVHELLGGGVAITFGGAPLRAATLEMYFDSETESAEAFEFFKDGYVFELTDTDAPSTNMYFVVAGSIERSRDMDTDTAWLLTVDVQEVVQ